MRGDNIKVIAFPEFPLAATVGSQTQESLGEKVTLSQTEACPSSLMVPVLHATGDTGRPLSPSRGSPDGASKLVLG